MRAAGVALLVCIDGVKKSWRLCIQEEMPRIRVRKARSHRKPDPHTSKTVGTYARVWHGSAKHTAGRLTRSDLMKTGDGRIVSKKKHAAGMRAYARLQSNSAAFALWRANAARRGRHAPARVMAPSMKPLPSIPGRRFPPPPTKALPTIPGRRFPPPPKKALPYPSLRAMGLVGPPAPYGPFGPRPPVS